MPELTREQESLRKNDKVQSVLFDKKIYNLNQVAQILKFLKYNMFYVDETANYYRIRQFNPGLHNYPRYSNKSSRKFPGVEFVIEYNQN